MRTFLACLLLVAATSNAQQNAPAPSASPSAPASTEAHQRAAELIELTGARKVILGHLDELIAAGRQSMLQQSPSINPAFVEEWAKRMRARFNVDDYLAVMVRVYEAHFSPSELKELIQTQKDANDSKPLSVSPELKEKLTARGTTVQSEIMGGCAQVGAKLGGDIGLEIQKEHPEWEQAAPPAPKM